MTLYKFILIIHIFSAIIGLGPGFVLTYIAMHAKTMTELKHAYYIRNRVHIFVMVGGALLLVTGVLMGVLQPQLFTEMWFSLSLILYLIALAIAPLLLVTKTKPIKEILAYHQGEEIPEKYKLAAKDLFFYEHITNVLLIVIIFLMIVKPFA